MSLPRWLRPPELILILQGATLLFSSACSYDFEQFASAPGSDQAGQSAAAGGEAGGSSGASTSSGGSISSSGDGSTSPCAGSVFDGTCWYLGPSGDSCDEACTDHGGVLASAATYVGTAAQGGSLSNCVALLKLLGVPQSPAQGFRNDGLGLGCHVYGNLAFWFFSPNYSSAAALRNARRVCGCNQ